MAAVDRKILERIEKLLRMAGPKSGATEHEKLSAATEALRLFNEHDLVVRERERPTKRRAQRQRQPASVPMSNVYEQPPPPAGYSPDFAGGEYPSSTSRQMPGSEWLKWEAPLDTTCALPGCGEPIYKGDPVWARVRGGVIECIHADRTGSCEW